jgi:hypothetical protein
LTRAGDYRLSYDGKGRDGNVEHFVEHYETSVERERAVKELEKEQKSRASRLVKNFLDLASLDIEAQFRNIIIQNIRIGNESEKVLDNLKSFEEFRRKIDSNVSTQLAIESLFCKLR